MWFGEEGRDANKNVDDPPLVDVLHHEEEDTREDKIMDVSLYTCFTRNFRSFALLSTKSW